MRTAPLERNYALTKIIEEAGCSYGALAVAVEGVARESRDHDQTVTKTAVGHWVAGHKPGQKVIGYLVEALSRRVGRLLTAADIGLASDLDPIICQDRLPPDPVASLVNLGSADVDRRTVITGAAYSIGALLLPLDVLREHADRSQRAVRLRSTVGDGELKAVRDMTKALTDADERLGGGHARTAVVEYLRTDVAGYLSSRFASATHRKDMFGAAASLAYLAGWKAHDIGRAGLAQQYYLRSFQLAQEHDPRAHAAYGLRILAHQAMDLGQHAHCVDLADEALALTRGNVDRGLESLFWLTAARARAAAGSPAEARTALRTAEALISKARAEQAPRWASLGGPAEARLAHQAGKTLQALNDLAAAETQLARAASCWDEARYPRVYALAMADLAETQCRQGHAEKACKTWDLALDSMDGIRSSRTRDAVVALRQHLAPYKLRGLAAAKRLDARAAKILAAT
ncbi:tetratricopeptide repeat protein [Actinoplanes aureus]|uniref:Tetratricopeptide repeat protein n=1 Tax=Actinoplanes aureus TaxID=2792083 RepID=A0A931CFG0_9ACTN|nr:tetratricopeptide repeat protein [Actinoplanes aureus]MBG0569154.1 tetratricopeptide repeat protein [Actinoplanes aureus]